AALSSMKIYLWKDTKLKVIRTEVVTNILSSFLLRSGVISSPGFVLPQAIELHKIQGVFPPPSHNLFWVLPGQFQANAGCTTH
ncbi:MAG: hypothetical protein Q7T76_01100, partial [Ferruginibacter sp.]|nr:hypothetical protein [Ferruginibacter sp.]